MTTNSPDTQFSDTYAEERTNKKLQNVVDDFNAALRELKEDMEALKEKVIPGYQAVSQSKFWRKPLFDPSDDPGPPPDALIMDLDTE